jgi:hypothetical protein
MSLCQRFVIFLIQEITFLTRSFIFLPLYYLFSNSYILIELTAIIRLLPKKPDTIATPEQIKVLRSFQNFSCIQDDAILLKRLGKKQASDIIERLKSGEEIELKG